MWVSSSPFLIGITHKPKQQTMDVITYYYCQNLYSETVQVNQENNINSTGVRFVGSHSYCARPVRLVTTTPECIKQKFNLSSLHKESQPDYTGDWL